MDMLIPLANGRVIKAGRYYNKLTQERLQTSVSLSPEKPMTHRQSSLIGLFRIAFAKNLTFTDTQILTKILEGEWTERESDTLAGYTLERLLQASDRLSDESRQQLNQELGVRLRELDLLPA
jgi:hypothetical protein